MSIVTFDTLKFVETLEKAGVSREQASAMATAVKDSHEGAELATKADLRDVESKLIGETVDLRHEMNIRFAKVEGELTLLKWMLGLVIAGIASLILKAFF
ncbi:CCDC90 family protein [Bordetella avium]|uniref:DUF1640 domain-containing protein n=1 Tax=Bordetella avium TaxID=521 RepID=UPI000E1A198C|nr:DUF1640 domain-containing protein [Bordetella avium]RIQ58114.1 DUF1640 domain-containing protein [Bordetella avium]WQE34671.1 DUF1640 domain-containing protein [Bordetella avium]SUV68309.1 phage protein [Bordetella avium]